MADKLSRKEAVINIVNFILRYIILRTPCRKQLDCFVFQLFQIEISSFSHSNMHNDIHYENLDSQ